MTGVFGVMKAAILADGTIEPLIEGRVYSITIPDDKKPPFISLAGSGNTPTQTSGGTMLEFPHITLNAHVQGKDFTTLKAIVDALVILFNVYVQQSGGSAYVITRIFDMPLVDPDGSLMWSFEYLVKVHPA